MRGVSSVLARLARLGPKSTRRMASVGMAAGMAAAFNAPIAAVTFTLEELIGDLDQTMLSGVIVATALAAVVEHSILGSNPVFQVQSNYTPHQLLIAGVVCAAGAARGYCLGRLHRFAAVPSYVVPTAQRSTSLGTSSHRRRSHRRQGGRCAGAFPPQWHRWRSI